MTTGGEANERRARLDWRGRLSGVLLGAAGGMGINVLSNDVGYRGVAAATAAGAVLSAATWLRQLPPRAPLVRHTTRTLLALALLGAAVAAVGPTSWAAYATLSAAALTVTAVLTINHAETAGASMGGAAFIGGGVAFIGIGIAALADSDILFGTAFIGGAVASIGFGIAFLANSNILFGIAFIGSGVALIGTGIGIAALADSDILFGTACIGGAVASIGTGIAFLADSDILFGIAGIGAGVALIGIGIAFLANSNILFGTACIGGGVALIGAGIVILVRKSGLRRRLRGWARP